MFYNREAWEELKGDLCVDQKWGFRMIQARYVLDFLRLGRYAHMIGKKAGVVVRGLDLQCLCQWLIGHLSLEVRYLVG